MNRRTLALGAGVVLAALIGLYALLRTDEPPVDRGPPVAVDPQIDHEITGTTPGKPRKIPDTPPPAVQPTPPTSEYTIGEMRIRDHRSGEHARPEIAPPSHPPGGRTIATQITGDLGQQIRPLLRACTASLPREARSDRSRVEGQITIAIKDHLATVTAAAFQLRDITEAAQAEVKQCLTQRAVGLTAPAGDEADLDSYGISLSLALP